MLVQYNTLTFIFSLGHMALLPAGPRWTPTLMDPDPDGPDRDGPRPRWTPTLDLGL